MFQRNDNIDQQLVYAVRSACIHETHKVKLMNRQPIMTMVMEMIIIIRKDFGEY